MENPTLMVTRDSHKFYPDNSRVITRPFLPGSPARIARISQRVLALSLDDTRDVLARVMRDFGHRHRDIEAIFLRHYHTFLDHLPEGHPLRRRTNSLEPERQLLLGSYFTSEYSIEAAAFFNPSMVPHPNQTGCPQGSTRFIVSFRATGEGHVSSIVFRTGTVNENHELTFAPASQFVEMPTIMDNPSYDKHCFIQKLNELNLLNFVSETILSALADEFTYRELDEQIWFFGENYPSAREHKSIETLRWIAHSNYEVHFPKEGDLSECVIFPVSENESRGLEDARFVRFVDDDGTVTYYATYTAYNGFKTLPQLLTTVDFATFRIATLNGNAVKDKGMALFPRKIDGHYMMISRQDGENLYLMTSDNIHFWNNMTPLYQPEEPWEFMQIGNCGSPIETEQGWLVLTHGVGPVRQYCIGAVLLDLNDPTQVIGHLKHPILVANVQEREGYVPNVVYSCGGMLHHEKLIIPYAMSDSISGIATLNLEDVLEQLV